MSEVDELFKLIDLGDIDHFTVLIEVQQSESIDQQWGASLFDRDGDLLATGCAATIATALSDLARHISLNEGSDDALAFDTASSASCQHYIDTGTYLRNIETASFRDLQNAEPQKGTNE